MDKNYLIFGGSALLILVVVLLLVFGGREFFSGAPAGSVSPDVSQVVSPTPSSPVDASLSASVSVEAPIRDFVFTASNYKYSLSEIRVKKGDRVKIVLQNTEGMHDLRIDEFNVETRRLQAGEEQMVEFIASKAGTFEYYCSVGTHRLMGMKGALIVE